MKPWERRAAGYDVVPVEQRSDDSSKSHPAERRRNNLTPIVVPKVSVESAASNEQPLQSPMEAAADDLLGTGEAGLTMASSMIAEPIAGIAGVGSAILGGAQAEMGKRDQAAAAAGTETVDTVRNFLTYAPRGQQGQEKLGWIADVMSPVGEGFNSVEKALGDFTFEITGSPEWAAAAYSTPTALLEAVGLGAIQRIRSGTRLLDDQNRPTKALQLALDEQGLNFDSLSPESRDLIPIYADPDLIPKRLSVVDETAETMVINEVAAGNRDSALAPLTIKEGTFGPKLSTDQLAVEVMKQGFPEGTIQLIKTATPETRAAMLEMLRIRRQIFQNQSLRSRTSQSVVTGNALVDRLTFIRSAINDARAKQDNLVKTNLAGTKVNGRSVVEAFKASLDDLGVRVVKNEKGDFEPVFMRSDISQDPASQKFIKRTMSLLLEPGDVDALRLHKLKRQLDAMIDFEKKAKGGLPDAGRRTAKAVRSQINRAIRAVDPEYALYNDIMSQGLTAIEDFQKAVGTSIDLFGDSADLSLGNRARAIMSNQQKVGDLQTSLDQLDDTALRLGGEFDVDIRDLASFSESLNARFGTDRTTSFQGDIITGTQKAVESIADQRGLTVRALDAASNKLEAMRGINELAAMRAMEDLLRRDELYQAPARVPAEISVSDFDFDPTTGLLNDNR